MTDADRSSVRAHRVLAAMRARMTRSDAVSPVVALVRSSISAR
jgi:hypothetical protein